MRIAEAADALADYMLFVDEAKIPGGGIEGSSGFAEKFTAQGPKDSKGRSLRELDLKTRLQKYPLSYMIYSPAFQSDAGGAEEPGDGEDRARAVGRDRAIRSTPHLTPEIRAAIREILQSTVERP